MSRDPSRSYLRALERLLSSPTLPKLGLLRMTELMRALGNPQSFYPVLHIAGTKGKGSTAAMTASVLREAGARVGLTTSPHLLSVRERIVIDGDVIDEATFSVLEARVHRAARSLHPALDEPSFFERTVAMAFCAFADANVDVAVVEVGLGGRLDATNIVAPAGTAVTRLGLDHQEFLGDTLAAIAREKAGIFKPGVPALTVAQADEAMAELERVARDVGCELVVTAPDLALRPALFGAHQVENASLAVALARRAGIAIGMTIDDDAVGRGLARVRWPGRYEVVRADDKLVVILDGAHNAESAQALQRALDDDARIAGRPRQLVIGMSRGHDVKSFVDVVCAGAASVIATRASQPRALPPGEVAAAASRHSVVDVIDDVSAAVETAEARGGVVVVTGSLFVVGEARARYVDMPRDPARPAY